MKSSMLFAAVACAHADSGTEYQCFGGKAHSVTYDIDGDSLETLQNAKVDIAPEPAMNGYCAEKEGDHDFCVGGNTDDCKTRRASLPINDLFSCDSCFAGLETDLFYSLEIKWLKLQRVELGLRDSHLRGAVEVRAQKDAAGQITSGSIPLIDGAKEAQVKFKIAGIIPFDLKISMPTTLEYSLGLHGSLDALAGADLDIDLGDHFISYEKDNGFSVHNTSMSVNFTPKLELTSATAAADLDLKVRSEVQVDLDSVMWYHLDVVPAMPSTLDFEHTAGETDKICLRSNVDVPLSHEADVHFTLLGKDHDVFHFGPEDLLHFHKENAINKCIDVPFADVVV
jgi:hypothetical protein